VLATWQSAQKEYQLIDEAWKSVAGLKQATLDGHLARLEARRMVLDRHIAHNTRVLQALLQREQVATVLAQQSVRFTRGANCERV
jgi:hypothetical protein